MDILKTSIDWARAELLSNGLFALFGAMFLVASLLFWSRGETDMAKAFGFPMIIAGVLMLILGGGLFYGTWKSLTGFSTAFADDNARFIGLEVQRIDRTMSQYGTAVFNFQTNELKHRVFNRSVTSNDWLTSPLPFAF